MRNARLHRMYRRVSHAGIAEGKLLRPVLAEPLTSVLGHDLGSALFGFQLTITTQPAEPAPVEKNAPVKMLLRVQREATLPFGGARGTQGGTCTNCRG